LDFEDGLKLMHKAEEKDQEDRAWSIWVALRPNMTKENFIPFSEYYRVERTPKTPPKTETEIMQDVEDIQRLFARGGGLIGDI